MTNPPGTAPDAPTAARAKRRRFIAIPISILAIIAIPMFWAAWRLSLAPSITRDYSAEFNAGVAAIPDSDRAWPAYRVAIVAAPEVMAAAFKPEAWINHGDTRPDDPAWPEVLASFRARDDLLLFARAAASTPNLGLPITGTVDPEIAAIYHYRPEQGGPIPHLASEPTPAVHVGRRFCDLLAIDARLALLGGEEERWLLDLESMLTIAGHARQPDWASGHYASALCVRDALETVLWALHDRPGALGDDTLARTGEWLRRLEDSPLLRVDLSHERAVFDDQVQRLFTNDGRGSGRMTLAGAAWLAPLAAARGRTVGQLDILWGSGRRAEVTRAADRMFAIAEGMASDPPRDWDASAVAELDGIIDGTGVAPPQLIALELSLRRINTAPRLAWRLRLLLAATRTLVAVERFGRDRARPPASLDELVPAYLDAPPEDYYAAGSLRWVLASGGAVLYSVGADGVDQGGRAPSENGSPTNQPPRASDAADWVFWPRYHRPRPASEPASASALEIGPPADIDR